MGILSISRLFARKIPETGENSVPSFAFCPSSRSRMVTGLEAGLLLGVRRFLRHREGQGKIQYLFSGNHSPTKQTAILETKQINKKKPS